MTYKNAKTSSKLLAIPIMAVLLTLTLAATTPDVFATTCTGATGNHCYAVVTKLPDNRGGYGTIDINSGNSVETSSAIVNAIWINFDNDEWIEGGWQKGSPMAPCSNTTAHFYWYETVGTTSYECITTTSGSTVDVKITDYDTNNTYLVYVDGTYETSVAVSQDGNNMQAGGESTNADNVLDGGNVDGLVYYNTAGTAAYIWGSTNLGYSNHMMSYTDTRTSPWDDYQFEGP